MSIESLIPMSLWPELLSAFSIGLLGGAHCIGMCGGIMAALSFGISKENAPSRWAILLSYNTGRIFSYVMIGVIAGLIGSQVAGTPVLRIIAGLLLIAMGLYLAQWWQGLTYLERIGQVLWRYIQPLGKNLLPVKNVPQGLALGALWGWLPCGLVYSALGFAMAQGNPQHSGLVMLFFGLGTLPAVLASGWAAEKIKAAVQNRNLRTLFALSIIGFGVWTMWGPISHAGHAGHGGHAPASEHGPAADGEMDHSQHH